MRPFPASGTLLAAHVKQHPWVEEFVFRGSGGWQYIAEICLTKRKEERDEIPEHSKEWGNHDTNRRNVHCLKSHQGKAVLQVDKSISRKDSKTERHQISLNLLAQ